MGCGAVLLQLRAETEGSAAIWAAAMTAAHPDPSMCCGGVPVQELLSPVLQSPNSI